MPVVRGDFDVLGDAIAILIDGDINEGDNKDCFELGDKLPGLTVSG
jgi:hypothetical protein